MYIWISEGFRIFVFWGIEGWVFDRVEDGVGYYYKWVFEENGYFWIEVVGSDRSMCLFSNYCNFFFIVVMVIILV